MITGGNLAVWSYHKGNNSLLKLFFLRTPVWWCKDMTCSWFPLPGPIKYHEFCLVLMRRFVKWRCVFKVPARFSSGFSQWKLRKQFPGSFCTRLSLVLPSAGNADVKDFSFNAWNGVILCVWWNPGGCRDNLCLESLFAVHNSAIVSWLISSRLFLMKLLMSEMKSQRLLLQECLASQNACLLQYWSTQPLCLILMIPCTNGVDKVSETSSFSDRFELRMVMELTRTTSGCGDAFWLQSTSDMCQRFLERFPRKLFCSFVSPLPLKKAQSGIGAHVVSPASRPLLYPPSRYHPHWSSTKYM